MSTSELHRTVDVWLDMCIHHMKKSINTFCSIYKTTRSEKILHTKLFNRHIENVLRCYIEPSKSKFIKKYQGLGPYLRTSYN